MMPLTVLPQPAALPLPVTPGMPAAETGGFSALLALGLQAGAAPAQPEAVPASCPLACPAKAATGNQPGNPLPPPLPGHSASAADADLADQPAPTTGEDAADAAPDSGDLPDNATVLAAIVRDPQPLPALLLAVAVPAMPIRQGPAELAPRTAAPAPRPAMALPAHGAATPAAEAPSAPHTAARAEAAPPAATPLVS